jgi:hypothetical protein
MRPHQTTVRQLLAGWTDESVRRRIEGEVGARAIAIMSAVIVLARRPGASNVRMPSDVILLALPMINEQNSNPYRTILFLRVVW